MSYASEVLADSPVAYWRCNDASGPTAADSADSHAGTYNGTYTLQQEAAVSGGASVLFQNTGSAGTDYLTAATGTASWNAITIEGWFKPAGEAFVTALGVFWATGANYWALSAVSGGTVTQTMRVDSVTGSDSRTITVGEWVHLAVTYDRSQAIFYLNGVAGTPQALSSVAIPWGTAGAFCGGNSGIYGMTGNLAEAAVYDKVLSADRILAHYAAATALTVGFYLSGGADNTTPNASLGGVISATEITDDTSDNLFDDVSAAEHVSGDVEYRCLYVQPSDALDNAVVWIDSDTTNADTDISIAVGTSAVGGEEQTIADESTEPTGVSWSDAATSLATGLALGDLDTGAWKAVWVRRTVSSGSTGSADQCVLGVGGEKG